jgi:hypothetical protein
MARKIQRRPVRYSLERIDKSQNVAKGFNIQSAVTILGGLTGIVVAIFWISGRSYMKGYFSAMNIPSSQISFSIWEYAETSWQYLIGYYLINTVTPITEVAIILFIIVVSIRLLQWLFPKLKFDIAIQGVMVRLSQMWQNVRYLLVLLVNTFANYGLAEG